VRRYKRGEKIVENRGERRMQRGKTVYRSKRPTGT
jgi:hypothetical protein